MGAIDMSSNLNILKWLFAAGSDFWWIYRLQNFWRLGG